MSESLLNVLFCMFQLHRIGAPVSKPIAPVMYMWRPRCLQNKGNDVASVDDQGLEKAESTESHSCFRQLWVWIHASAFSEGYDALRLACEKEVNITFKPREPIRSQWKKLQNLKNRILGEFRSH